MLCQYYFCVCFCVAFFRYKSVHTCIFQRKVYFVIYNKMFQRPCYQLMTETTWLFSFHNYMSRRHADIWSHPGHYLVDPYTWPWSHLTLKIQISRSWPRSNPLLFVSCQSDHFWSRYSKFHIWPWKFKVKVMAKVKSDGHIWGLEFNRYVCFLFHGNRTIFGRDIANSVFDLENSRSRSWPRSNPMVAFEALRSIDVFAFHFLAIGPFFAEI